MAEATTPAGLGEYLTQLVGAKNEHFPTDDIALVACGIIGTWAALGQTTPHGIGRPELMQAIAFVLQRVWSPRG